MKKAIALVLLMAAYVFISNAVGSVVYLVVRRPGWPTTEYMKVVLFAVFSFGISLGMVRLAAHWWARWRTALAWIAMVIGLAGVLQSIILDAVISQALLISSLLGVAFGVVLLLWPRFFRATRS